MKTVLITGIGRGIGKALAEKFLAEGFGVIGTVRDGDFPARENLTVFPLDLSKSESISECVTKIAESGAKVDILINNAGILADDGETKLISKKLRETLEVNLIGTADFTEQITSLIRNDGHIVNISSAAGSLGDMDHINHSHSPYKYPAYKISKAALNMYTRTLAVRLKHEGSEIIVSAVHPGWVRTDMGGDDANISPAEAADEIFKLAVSRPANGEFWFNGKKFPW